VLEDRVRVGRSPAKPVSDKAKRRITPCIPSKANRKTAIPHDAILYKQRHKIENMFGRLKDWRRIHTRYDRCAHTYFSAICIAAAVIFWLLSMSPDRRYLLENCVAAAPSRLYGQLKFGKNSVASFD
jgi:hypothetical protein